MKGNALGMELPGGRTSNQNDKNDALKEYDHRKDAIGKDVL